MSSPLDEYRLQAATPSALPSRSAAKSPRPAVCSWSSSTPPRALHYDLRLEMGGVLKSWAVPKGPSIRSHEKRLAVHVEDHPIEYADFEGVIPKDNYGAGAVILWDQGRYRLLHSSDPLRQLEEGTLEIELQGYKLRGVWMLVRMGGGGKEWLLFSKNESEAGGGTGGGLSRLHPVGSHRIRARGPKLTDRPAQADPGPVRGPVHGNAAAQAEPDAGVSRRPALLPTRTGFSRSNTTASASSPKAATTP